MSILIKHKEGFTLQPGQTRMKAAEKNTPPYNTCLEATYDVDFVIKADRSKFTFDIEAAKLRSENLLTLAALLDLAVNFETKCANNRPVYAGYKQFLMLKGWIDGGLELIELASNENNISQIIQEETENIIKYC